MSDVFQTGDQGSATVMMSALNALHGQGATVLAGLETAYTDVLIAFERRLSALNSRRQRAGRVPTVATPLRLSLGDFIDVDQSQSTSTVRIDAGSATLRQRSNPVEAIEKSCNFSTD